MIKPKLSKEEKRKAEDLVDNKFTQSLSIRSLTVSPIITIVAGKERLKLNVHEHVVKKADSPAINALLNGKWREAKEKLIDWSNFDSEVVLCVVRFLYYKKYSGKVATHAVTDRLPMETHQRKKAKKADDTNGDDEKHDLTKKENKTDVGRKEDKKTLGGKKANDQKEIDRVYERGIFHAQVNNFAELYLFYPLQEAIASCMDGDIQKVKKLDIKDMMIKLTSHICENTNQQDSKLLKVMSDYIAKYMVDSDKHKDAFKDVLGRCSSLSKNVCLRMQEIIDSWRERSDNYACYHGCCDGDDDGYIEDFGKHFFRADTPEKDCDCEDD